MRNLGLFVAIGVGLCLAAPVRAQDEALSKKCNAIYVKLCKGIKPGPSLVGKCNEKRPKVAGKIPAECVEDFQSAVEGYNDSKSH